MKLNPLQRFLIRNMKQYFRLDHQGVSIYMWPSHKGKKEIQKQLPRGFVEIPGLNESEYHIWTSNKYISMVIWSVYWGETTLVHVLKYHNLIVYDQNYRACLEDSTKWFALKAGQQE